MSSALHWQRALRHIRNETGIHGIHLCPVCGSGAWDNESYCNDCGFDAAAQGTIHPPKPKDPGYDLSDPKHPDHHDTFSDLTGREEM